MPASSCLTSTHTPLGNLCAPPHTHTYTHRYVIKIYLTWERTTSWCQIFFQNKLPTDLDPEKQK